MDKRTDEEIILDKYWPEFVYQKETISEGDPRFYIAVDYDRLRHLISEYPREAFELAAAVGYVDMDTGLIKENYTQENIQDFFEWGVLECVDLIGSIGMSGNGKDYFSALLKSILDRRPIAPLTGNDWEWVDVTEVCDSPTPLYQNRRFTTIFKDLSHAYWIDGRIFVDGENTYTNQHSAVDVKFPCLACNLEKEYVAV